MERMRFFLLAFVLLLGGILVFSLTKSWLVYDRGIQVIPAEEGVNEEEEDKNVPDSSESSDGEDWQDDARIFWKNALVYPVGLNNESGGFGPDGVMHHARNLLVVNLQTGKKRKLFPKNVYIWDFFHAEFSRKTGFTSSDEPKTDSLSLSNKILIFASTRDTNLDGFLNIKDKKKVFLYDAVKDKFFEILPEDIYFEKLIWNAGDERLAMVVKRGTLDKDEKRNYKFGNPLLFIYDTIGNRKTIVDILE